MIRIRHFIYEGVPVARFSLLSVVCLLLVGTAPAAEPADSQRLAQVLRGLLLKNLPDPVLESGRGWGHQKEVVVGLKWHRAGRLRLKAEPQKALRNNGHWQKVRIQAIDPARTLSLAVRDLKHPEAGKTTFEAYAAIDTRLTYEQQLWKSGVRLYAGETRARCRAVARLACEFTNRLEARPGSLLPDAVIRVRVTEAELNYTDFVCEHTAGLDGDAAKKVGEAVLKFLKQAKPSLERDLLAKANAAIVKAADTREVRIELDKLLLGKLK